MRRVLLLIVALTFAASGMAQVQDSDTVDVVMTIGKWIEVIGVPNDGLHITDPVYDAEGRLDTHQGSGYPAEGFYTDVIWRVSANVPWTGEMDVTEWNLIEWQWDDQYVDGVHMDSGNGEPGMDREFLIRMYPIEVYIDSEWEGNSATFTLTVTER